MLFNILLNEDDWNTKQVEDHNWMKANVAGYEDNTESWAKIEWNKHPDEEKWHLMIPEGHSDVGVELTSDWIPEE